MISINSFNKEKNLDIFKYDFNNLAMGNFPLFIKDFFHKIQYPYCLNTKNIKENTVEVYATTKYLNLNDIFSLLNENVSLK